jgi:hypothetical protein
MKGRNIKLRKCRSSWWRALFLLNKIVNCKAWWSFLSQISRWRLLCLWSYLSTGYSPNNILVFYHYALIVWLKLSSISICLFLVCLTFLSNKLSQFFIEIICLTFFWVSRIYYLMIRICKTDFTNVIRLCI